MACENELADLTFAVGQLNTLAIGAQVAAGAVVAKAMEMQAAANVAQQSLIALVAGVNVVTQRMNAYNGCLLQQVNAPVGPPALATKGCCAKPLPTPTLTDLAEMVAQLQRQLDSLTQGT